MGDILGRTSGIICSFLRAAVTESNGFSEGMVYFAAVEVRSTSVLAMMTYRALICIRSDDLMTIRAGISMPRKAYSSSA